MRNGTVSNYEDALSILQQEAAAGDPYDLAIIDVNMDGAGGLELAAGWMTT